MRILLADDHDLVRETIASFLMGQPGFRAVEETATLGSALKLLRQSEPFDLVLLDYDMPGMDALTGLSKVLDHPGVCPVAILSGTATPSIARAAINAGAKGFVPKTLGAQSIVSAIKLMVAGETFVPFDFMQVDADSGGLTPRESAVLEGLGAGKSNKEIARDLNLQEVTIKLHVKNLSRKLGARNRTHAAMIAKERGLL